MACRNSVASEEFADFIAPYFTSPENFMRSQGTDCIDFVNSTLAVVYIPFSTITSFSYTSYTYSAIPKLYSLLDVTSMDAAGIKDGYVVIVRRQDIVDNGQIAVCLIDGQDATLKRFSQEGNIVTLMPQSTNPEHKPFVFDITKTQVKILGLVVRAEFSLV